MADGQIRAVADASPDSSAPEYRIDFSIMRLLPGEEDFSEFGFGSTTAERSIGEAGHMALSAIQNNEWDEV